MSSFSFSASGYTPITPRMVEATTILLDMRAQQTQPRALPKPPTRRNGRSGMALDKPPSAAVVRRHRIIGPADTTKRYSIKQLDQDVVSEFAKDIGREMLLSTTKTWEAFLATKAYDAQTLKMVKGLRRRTINTESKSIKKQRRHALEARAAASLESTYLRRGRAGLLPHELVPPAVIVGDDEDVDLDLAEVEDCPEPAPL